MKESQCAPNINSRDHMHFFMNLWYLMKFPLRNQKTYLNTMYKKIKERKAWIECENSQFKYKNCLFSVSTSSFYSQRSEWVTWEKWDSLSLQCCLTASSLYSITQCHPKPLCLTSARLTFRKYQWSGVEIAREPERHYLESLLQNLVYLWL